MKDIILGMMCSVELLSSTETQFTAQPYRCNLLGKMQTVNSWKWG